MKKFSCLFGVFFGLSLFMSQSLLAADSPLGYWKTINEETNKPAFIVEIYEKDNVVYGKILKSLDGAPQGVCGACEGDKKDQPIEGMVSMWGMKKDGEEYADGKILDVKDGKIYTSKIWVEEGNLKVRGYILFLYRTQTWLRLSDDEKQSYTAQVAPPVVEDKK
mgnify:CR=1 FL=1|tara:strand:- start:1047 stop:1538 length:492 start_codon:yes stop_codon:yes gene_type:complete